MFVLKHYLFLLFPLLQFQGECNWKKYLLYLERPRFRIFRNSGTGREGRRFNRQQQRWQSFTSFHFSIVFCFLFTMFLINCCYNSMWNEPGLGLFKRQTRTWLRAWASFKARDFNQGLRLGLNGPSLSLCKLKGLIFKAPARNTSSNAPCNSDLEMWHHTDLLYQPFWLAIFCVRESSDKFAISAPESKSTFCTTLSTL